MVTVAYYTGRYRDLVTGLQYNRARWYDAHTGRWLSEDPIGFEAGDANLYRYVGNGSIQWIDPAGLWIIERNGGRTAKAISEDRDSLSSLAKIIGVGGQRGPCGDVFEPWLTYPDGDVYLANGEVAPPSGSLCGSPICGSLLLQECQEFEIPNTIVAVWGGEVGRLGQWWVAWDAEIMHMRLVGFHVEELYNRGDQGWFLGLEASFPIRAAMLSRQKALYGVYTWSHGSHGSDPSWLMNDGSVISYAKFARRLSYPLGVGVINFRSEERQRGII